MITLSRLGITVTPESAGAEVKLNAEPEGRLAGAAFTGAEGCVDVLGVPLEAGADGVVVVAGADVAGSEVAAAVGNEEDPSVPPQLASSTSDTAPRTWEIGPLLSIGR